MKVLFAVSNDNVASSIIKKYQEKYKEIITNKNVYYFNAIIKELQIDKTYDVVIIGEDLEPISNNNYDTIDKFIFEKLDNISDEASKPSGEDIPIILICSDRRTKSDGLLIKLFGIGIYNALLGNDRNVDMVCDLINKPRNKKEAKEYYKIESEDVNYKPEKELEVSENEIQNILSHYKKIGNNEKKCIESFDKIAVQYNDTQLRIITKFLPLNVKNILEKGSQRYQQLMTGGTVLSNGKYTKYDNTNKNMDFLSKDLEKNKLEKPVIIPSTMNIPQNNGINNGIQNTQRPMQNNGGQNTPKPMQNTPIQNVAKPIQNNVAQNMQKPVRNTPVQNNVVQNVQKPIQNTPIQNNVIQNVPKPIQNTIPNIDNTIQNVPKTDMPKQEQDNKITNTQDINNNNIKPVPEDKMQTHNLNINPQNNLNPYDLYNMVSINEMEEEEKEMENLNNVGSDLENIKAKQVNNNNQEQAKRRGRPKKVVSEEVQEQPKRRGRPRKTEENIENKKEVKSFGVGNEPLNLFNMSDEGSSLINNSYNPYINNANPYDQINSTLPKQETPASVYDSVPTTTPYDKTQTDINTNPYNDMQSNFANSSVNPYNPMQNDQLYKVNNENNNSDSFIARNSKLVAFVGTSKNGTSFLVNNLAELLSQRGINTAVLDLTKNKNSYYMFTDNNPKLMQTATNSIKNLSNGNVNGVKVNNNLTIFTSLPGEGQEAENVGAILQTLDKNYSAVLMDCDFKTNSEYFRKATEIYLVQSMDALTIQPLTLFLSELKAKNALDENKLRVVINKEMKLKILNEKMILGGMSKYNEPSMTLQRDLFNPNTMKYISIPFEDQTYARYLEAIAACKISLSGYSQRFLGSLNQLANMVYPLIPGANNNDKGRYVPANYGQKRGMFGGKEKKQPTTQFGSGVNDTLNRMKNNY